MAAGEINFSGLNSALQSWQEHPPVTNPLGSALAGYNTQQEAFQKQDMNEGALQKTNLDNIKSQQELIANTAFAVSQRPPEEQAAAYTQNLQMLQNQGVDLKGVPLEWDKGGKELTNNLAMQSPLYATQQKALQQQFDNNIKSENLKVAQANAANTKAKTDLALKTGNQTTVIPDPGGKGNWQRVPGQGPLPETQAQAVADGINALPQIETIKSILFDEKGNVKTDSVIAANAPLTGGQGVPGTDGRTAKQAIKRTVEVMLRLRTGAAAPDQEVKNYTEMFSPSVFDTSEQARVKVSTLENQFKAALAGKGMQFVPNDGNAPTQQAAPDSKIPSYEEFKKTNTTASQSDYDALVKEYNETVLKKAQASSQQGLGAQILK